MEEKKFPEERRKHKRVEGFFEVFINFKPEPPSKFYCNSRDISEGGMRIRTSKPLKQGNHAILTFNLPSYSKEIVVQVVVAWASDISKEDGRFESGIKFLIMNDIESEAIRSYVSQHTDRIA